MPIVLTIRVTGTCAVCKKENIRARIVTKMMKKHTVYLMIKTQKYKVSTAPREENGKEGLQERGTAKKGKNQKSCWEKKTQGGWTY